MLYSDAVEMKNPLGASKGTYKIVFIYYTLCEITKSQRSKIDRIQLTMAFKEKLLKTYSLKTILKPLIDDLKALELGVEVKNPTGTLKAGVACYISDNLEAAFIGGFSGSFSSRDICRVCHIQHGQLGDQIHHVQDFWTEEEYDRICDSKFETMEEEDPNLVVVQKDNLFNEFDSESDSDDESDIVESGEDGDDESQIQTRGLRSRCPLNCLQSFHAVTSFPLDIMHDLFEGKLHLNCSKALLNLSLL